MKFTIGTCLLAAGVFASGCAAESTATSTTSAPLTTDDVDFAPECEGILRYVNTVSLFELDSLLPSDVAAAIVARRQVRPFVDIADISSVAGIGQARLEQITRRVRNIEFVGDECVGTFEELAISEDDRLEILFYVNLTNPFQLAQAARDGATAQRIVAARPIDSIEELVAIQGVGPATFRALRDAATVGPFDQLADRVNAAGQGVSVLTTFDWRSVMLDEPDQRVSAVCFGIAPELVAQIGGTVRPNLATGAEVLAEVASDIDFADRFGQVGDATDGLADLARQVDGQTFFGCTIRFASSPFSGLIRDFFVNTQTGYRVLTEVEFSE